MSLTATSTTTHVTNASATTSVTFTPAANSLVVCFVAGDANNGSTDEALTVAASGFTFTRVQRSNGHDGGVAEIWYTTAPTSTSMTVNVTDNKGSVDKFIKVVWFTDSGGSIPQIGRSAGSTDFYDQTIGLTLLSTAAASQFWLFAVANSNFSTQTGETLVDNINTGGGFTSDATGLYSLTATSSGADQESTVTVNTTNTPFHMVGLEITVPGVTQTGLFIRNIATGLLSGTGSTQTKSLILVTPTNTQVGDVLLIIHGNDFYNLADMPTPTVTPSATVTAITNGSVDAGNNVAHIKSYTAVVATAGEQMISLTETSAGDEEKCLTVYVLAGANTTTPVDVANGSFNNSSQSTNIAPSVTTTQANDMLICYTNTENARPTSYTPPSGMTETVELNIVGGLGVSSAYKQLSSSGATGTQAFTPVSSTPYVALTVAIEAAPAGGANGSGVSAWFVA